MTNRSNPLGNVFISHKAIATIACQTVTQSYGVVGLAAKNIAIGLAQAIVKDPTMGVDVTFDGKDLKIDIFIIVEYGTRIKTVATSVANTVRYQVESTTSLPVSQVNVHIRGLRISNTD